MKSWFPKLIVFILLAVLFVPLIAESKIIKIENPFGESSTIWTVLDKIINFIILLAIAIAPIMFIVAGFYYLTAVGDPKKIQIAKDIILYTLIGLIIIISAKGLVTLFKEIFKIR